MISDEKLIDLNYRGFIPGPGETEDIFCSRVEYTETFYRDPYKVLTTNEQNKIFSFRDKVKKPRWSWVRSCLVHLFDFSPHHVEAYYDNFQLPFFQGGATWILEKEGAKIRLPVIQVKKELKKKPFFFLYTLEEILSHEAIHAARVAFDENLYEEVFAYWSSSSMIRRIFGPLFQSSRNLIYILSFLMGMIAFQVGGFLFPTGFFSYGYLLCASLLGTFSIFGLGKLFVLRHRMKKALKNLEMIVQSKEKARHVLFRLTDEEIFLFSKFSSARIETYIEENREKTLRWRMLNACYFKKSTK